MKPTVSLAFTDFWPTFNPRDNYFTRLWAARFEVRVVELSERPRFVLYSCFGRQHRQHQGTRIFFSGENWRADFSACDYAFTFDHSDHPRHYRLPLYAIYGDPARLIKTNFDAVAVLAGKTRFCNFVYSNPLCRTRNKFFHELSQYKHIDSGGKVFNNLGGPVADKLALLRESKFTIAFENEGQPGYTTEKLCQPMQAGSLPIYWGNPLVGRDFNPRSFISAHDWPSLQQVIEHVIEVDRDDELYLEYLRQPWFADNRVNEDADPQNVLNRFEQIFLNPQPPVARQRSAAKFFYLDRAAEVPTSLARRVKRTARKVAYRVWG